MTILPICVAYNLFVSPCQNQQLQILRIVNFNRKKLKIKCLDT